MNLPLSTYIQECAVIFAKWNGTVNVKKLFVTQACSTWFTLHASAHVFLVLLKKVNDGFTIGKTEHFKALAKNDNSSAIADHVKTTEHNIKWDHFDILAQGKTDYRCKIKETLFIQEFEPAFNVYFKSTFTKR